MVKSADHKLKHISTIGIWPDQEARQYLIKEFRIRDSAVDGTLSHLVVRIRDSAVDGTLSHLVVRKRLITRWHTKLACEMQSRWNLPRTEKSAGKDDLTLFKEICNHFILERKFMYHECQTLIDILDILTREVNAAVSCKLLSFAQPEPWDKIF